MNNYELVLIFGAAVPGDEQKKTLSKVEKILSQQGGKVTTTDDWGKKVFAYPIKKLTEGNYFLLKFTTEPNVADEANKNLRIEEKVLRHLMLKIS